MKLKQNIFFLVEGGLTNIVTEYYFRARGFSSKTGRVTSGEIVVFDLFNATESRI